MSTDNEKPSEDVVRRAGDLLEQIRRDKALSAKSDKHRDRDPNELTVVDNIDSDGIDIEDLDLEDVEEDRHWLASALIASGVVLSVLTVIGLFSWWWIHKQFEPGKPGNEVSVEIAKGSTKKNIADKLDSSKVINSSGFFQLYAELKGSKPFQAGSYTFRVNERLTDVIAQLEAGPEISVNKLVIPEGFTIAQIAERVGKLPGKSAQRFSDAANGGKIRSKFQPEDVTSLEGLVFPDTYYISASDSEETILKRLVDQFDDVLDTMNFVDAAEANAVSVYDQVKIAAMVEREAKVDEERPLISGVIYNRIERNMRLNIDATLSYVLGGRAPTTAEFSSLDSPYNTYTNDGFGPTPIASPGKSSLLAAANPATHQDIFYVISDADGRHAFAQTLAQHNSNVAAARSKGLL